MGELRKDPFLNRWVLYAPRRGVRPHELKEVTTSDHAGDACFFCPGNEGAKTPPEIGRIADEHGDWRMRWFENKFAAVSLASSHTFKTEPPWYTSVGAFGHHEVIVETPDHSKQLWDLPLQDLTWLLGVYADRLKKVGKMEGVKYVQVFKNCGVKAGTSIVHTHSQVIGVPVIPPLVEEELKAVEARHRCPFCELVEREATGPRLCFQNEGYVAIAPYASQYQYEVWIIPRRHARDLEEITSKFLLAELMTHVLAKLKELGAEYNMTVNYAPQGRNGHFTLRFLPRLSTWAGFELGTGIPINSVMPEDAAQFYGEKG